MWQVYFAAGLASGAVPGWAVALVFLRIVEVELFVSSGALVMSFELGEQPASNAIIELIRAIFFIIFPPVSVNNHTVS